MLEQSRKSLTRFGVRHRRGKTLGLEQGANQFGIVGVVFQMRDPQWARRLILPAGCFPVALGPVVGRWKEAFFHHNSFQQQTSACRGAKRRVKRYASVLSGKGPTRD